MTAWLPFRRTSTKPSAANKPQTSLHESFLRLATRDLEIGYEDLAVHPILDFTAIGGLEKQLDGFLEINARLLDGCSLAGNIQSGHSAT